MLYFDHAASSFPKPKEVGEAMKEAVDLFAANPGRGGHALSQQAASVVKRTRAELASLFEAPGEKHVWFYQNATMALNQAILGFPFEEGDHILSTAYEHNSVLRPLKVLEDEVGVKISYVEPNEQHQFEIHDVLTHLTDKTRMVIVSHASNVTGALFPIQELAEKLKNHSAILLVDASQTAGKVDIQMQRDGIDLLAFAGHKGLMGPQGTGVLISDKDYLLKPLIHGGTGTSSEQDYQPESWPERYEAGTLNTPGIAGLHAGVQAVKQMGITSIREHEEGLMQQFLEGVSELESVHCYGPEALGDRVAVISFHVKHSSSHEVAMILDSSYQMAVRAGLHCAPKTHLHLGTIQDGLVRVSFGPYNTSKEVDELIGAIKEIEEAFTD
ncbi:aminotransferase class V-fold PLP-dependent enzyme [Alkalicoccobacillus murimartini]|uniref:cysteine desulfurase n=1 Tax=Alkalicoccobacillus murimartini TaxID=171685 RepID=A0ABT9YNR1_9BACI|nr:aminotransferase class V-fold PLP-dependent enzyme [Alkalicoccobacillus murimartini]MDQ0209130.1 cysteine desulfurase family protein [Alkalicoccobacillus murimartini]